MSVGEGAQSDPPNVGSELLGLPIGKLAKKANRLRPPIR
jgi:hypothetical protein